MRLLWSLLALIVLSGARAIADSSPQIFIVQVHGTTADRRDIVTSGVIIQNDGGLLVATTANPLRDLHDISIRTQAREQLAARNVQFIPGYDLAIVRTSEPQKSYAAAQLATPNSNGEPAQVWGTRMMRATIIGTRVRFEPSQSARLGLVCETCEPSDAGAGIFSQNGSLLGIIAARWDYGDEHGRLSLMEGEPASALAPATSK